jgi:hypothetical protein
MHLPLQLWLQPLLPQLLLLQPLQLAQLLLLLLQQLQLLAPSRLQGCAPFGPYQLLLPLPVL